MNRFCPKCGNTVDERAPFCTKCGAHLHETCRACGAPLSPGKAFCEKCGAPVQHAPAAPAQQAQPVQHAPVPPAQPAQPVHRVPTQQTPPAQHAAQQPQPQRMPPTASQQYSQQVPHHAQQTQRYAQQAPKKSKAGLIAGLGIGSVLLVALIIVGAVALSKAVSGPNMDSSPKPSGAAADSTQRPSNVDLLPFPAELKVNTGDIKVNCDYKSPDHIIPANYRSMDYVVFLQCWTDTGKTDAMVEVEIPGFTQKYQQKIEVSRAETELKIHPPLLDGIAKTLNSSKEAQIVISVKDLNSGKIVVQDTKPVKLYSRYDMQWQDSDGTPYYENILAWVTPEAPEIKTLLRLSADSCNELTNGQLDAIVGYQRAVSGWEDADITYVQAFAMMHALAKTCGVKYIMAPFSSTDSSLQRVATPSEVINSAGGLCAETAVTIASALQATNMHAVIIVLPGHMQTAVETWQGSGEYILIETTALTSAAAGDHQKVMTYKTKQEWQQYVAQEGVVIIDCDLAEQLHIQSID